MILIRSILSTLTFIGLSLGVWAQQPQTVYHVAIVKFVQHPALNQEADAIEEALNAAGFKKGDNLKIHTYDGQGNIASVRQMASQIAALKPHVVVAIATPAALALSDEMKKHQIPMVFTAVTDPVGSKLVQSQANNNTDSLVTGVSDAIDMKEAISLIEKAIPKARKIGVIVNNSEQNSVLQVNQIKTAIKDTSLQLQEAQAAGTAQVYEALTRLLDDVDVILVQHDNTAASALDTIVKTAHEKKIPVITADMAHLSKNVLGVAGLDRTVLGKMAGQQVVEILHGKKPSDIPVQTLDKPQHVINVAVAKELGINIPDGVQKRE